MSSSRGDHSPLVLPGGMRRARPRPLLLLLLAFLWRDARREAAWPYLARRTGLVRSARSWRSPLPLFAGTPLFCLSFFARAFFSYAAALAVAATFCLAYPWLLYLAGVTRGIMRSPGATVSCCALAGTGRPGPPQAPRRPLAAELALPLQRRFLRRGLGGGLYPPPAQYRGMVSPIPVVL